MGRFAPMILYGTRIKELEVFLLSLFSQKYTISNTMSRLIENPVAELLVKDFSNFIWTSTKLLSFLMVIFPFLSSAPLKEFPRKLMLKFVRIKGKRWESRGEVKEERVEEGKGVRRVEGMQRIEKRG